MDVVQIPYSCSTDLVSTLCDFYAGALLAIPSSFFGVGIGAETPLCNDLKLDNSRGEQSCVNVWETSDSVVVASEGDRNDHTIVAPSIYPLTLPQIRLFRCY